ncbi:hypothetical protein VTN77DRAFT_8327 [Rasamsonia byssochlamydoides]|uniref:uncharacterized protein n=1 Tax=Rasamsonia byssochlamydoides TaxID=89139 RepID=UPI003743F80E
MMSSQGSRHFFDELGSIHTGLYTALTMTQGLLHSKLSDRRLQILGEGRCHLSISEMIQASKVPKTVQHYSMNSHGYMLSPEDQKLIASVTSIKKTLSFAIAPEQWASSRSLPHR